MPKQLRWSIKQSINQARTNINWAFSHLLKVQEIYLANDAPDYAERVQLIMEALAEIDEGLEIIYDLA